MSNLALILFDFDGMTAVVPRKSLQQCSPEELVQSSRAYVKVGKENLQVEVLELSGELTFTC